MTPTLNACLTASFITRLAIILIAITIAFAWAIALFSHKKELFSIVDGYATKTAETAKWPDVAELAIGLRGRGKQGSHDPR